MKRITFLIPFLILINCASVVDYVQPAGYAKNQELLKCTIQVGIIPAKYKMNQTVKYEPNEQQTVTENIPEEPPVEEDMDGIETSQGFSYNDGVIFETVEKKKLKRKIIKKAYTRTVTTSPRQIVTLEPELVEPAKPDMRNIVCPDKVNSKFVKRIQLKLKSLGQDPGGTNGKLYKKTMEAINIFEKKKGLKDIDQSGSFDGRYFIMQNTADLLDAEKK
ncbi:MAG: hypothetical protein KDK36_16320 [Leptospiraceae bacterium]|nr:hypothetical protein [Leptospiraceae bacterium]